ncbi:biotin-dependent carboxyltransferase family protein [Aneurinibacillus sp. Ricciae_BoGa-3]|uniref:5-oxoprolinase subunit C family protein n=1 Tax=Aneurinibacillus sp. Ricciae_BoGa-3 TaxID=3022697 RepID=UPI00234191E6|nr:biotin-dependent carboxyltransferase family protein [Aneurinibacillus sp. Ricciae_BoGa-3]WCK54435.1 biotin-dependent carboxyltransferase family protein [Aneurinibacillus sp. Ricciae_BoGa-3]
MQITVLRPGLLTTLQDGGRNGLQKYGVIMSGAMDSFALRMANLLVGNEENEAVLEITLVGPQLRFDTDGFISICGSSLSPEIDGEPVPEWRPVYVRAGSSLIFKQCRAGCRTYLAAAGGFHAEKVLGSRSTYLRAGIGGYNGRALQKDDVLVTDAPSEQSEARMEPIKGQCSASFSSVNWSIGRELMPDYRENPVVRVVRGAQAELFTEQSRHAFYSEPFAVQTQSDRMGYRLKGEVLELAQQQELISEAVCRGTIQVPPEGQPILLMADCQTTGGYPKIGQVISVDLPVVAQVKPGETISFKEVSLEEAQRLLLQREQDIEKVKHGIYLQTK